MSVAKTYSNFPIEGEPFKENGRMYVNVRAPKGIKKVRWYTDAEYKRMYPDEVVKTDIMDFDARHAFGFGPEGFITIYKGHNLKEWAEDNLQNLRYNNTFLYYTPGRLELPRISEGIEPIKLIWDEVKYEGNKMKSHEEVSKYVANLLSTDVCGTSEYQGSIDEWLQKEVTVREKSTKESRFGTKHTYYLDDAMNNTYVWETGAKDYPCNMVLRLKMKVKEHKEINGTKVTIVWYCKEV